MNDDVRTAVRNLCYKVLDRLHPGWQELVGLPEEDDGVTPDTDFRRWLSTQPAGYIENILNTWDPIELSDAIEKFLACQSEVDELERLYRDEP